MYRGMSWEAMRVRSIHLRETEITDMAAKHFETFSEKYNEEKVKNRNIFGASIGFHYKEICGKLCW